VSMLSHAGTPLRCPALQSPAADPNL